MLKDNKVSKQKGELLVSLRNAGVARGHHWLVHGIDLDVHRGEIVTLIGPNGSGKSTTAKMALKILKPTQGSVMQMSGLKVGYVPQKLNLDRTLPFDVFNMMQLTQPLSKDLIMSSLDEVGATHLLHEQVVNLSGGELQRVLLARAAARKPDLLVLDEPLQGVDYAAETVLYQLIADYRDKLNCAILLISHDLHMVMAASDLVVCLNGHICCSGRPEDVTDSAVYNELFGRNPRFEVLAPYHHPLNHHAHDDTCHYEHGNNKKSHYEHGNNEKSHCEHGGDEKSHHGHNDQTCYHDHGQCKHVPDKKGVGKFDISQTNAELNKASKNGVKND